MKNEQLVVRCETWVKDELLKRAEKLQFDDISTLIRSILKEWLKQREEEDEYEKY